MSTLESGIFYESAWTGNKLPEGYTLIAAIDESASYEVDITEVYRTPTGFAIVTASGCSCWDGDYDEKAYATLDEVIAALGPATEDVGYRYNPSGVGAADLIGQLQALS
jgi:hypothetical protein